MEHLCHTPSWSWGLCVLLVLLTTMQFYSTSASAARFVGNVTDRMALIDIKLQMSDPSGFLNSWNDSQHHCQWPGVSCNMQHRRVTNLTLVGKSMSGIISPHIGNLSFMKGIRLQDNSLHGGIPYQIGQLSRLRLVNLSHNLLSGEISVNLTRCPNLRYINLQHNQLTGKIPAELGSLKKLGTLYIGANNLTGKIPASLGNLSSTLAVLYLGYNNLEGHVPNELGSLRRLISLNLGPNRLRGEIPPSLFNISTLILFSVASNFLSGQLPTNLGLNLPNLELLEFGANQFSGGIPASVTNCTYLQILELSENTLEGKVPPTIGHLNLQFLNLQMNFLSGDIKDILIPLTNCTGLIELSLGYNKFSGELPNAIGNLSSNLIVLFITFTEITGTIPMELGNLVSLDMLSLFGNSLTGVIPANLAKLQNLGQLALHNNMLSGHIPLTLCSNMTKLSLLSLSDNNLGGNISHSLAKCHGLQNLYISRNRLIGSITSHIFGSYMSPIQLDLSSNLLSGTIPIEVGNLVNLQQLDFSHNKLSGHIPSTIGDCSIITLLAMHNNNLSGSLPPSLTFLKGIEQLDLSDNTLTGRIPSGLCKLIYLTYLNLSYNDLEGEVPTDGVFSNASQIMLQGNNKLCGGISELRLPACPLFHQKTNGKKDLKIILTPLLSVLALSITLYLYLFFRNKIDAVGKRMPSLPTEREILRVSYNELNQATDQFSPSNLIGSGGFGFVYKGSLVLEHGEIKVVAVKVIDLKIRGASKSFKAECKALSNLRHRNLVPLLTYCSSIDHKGEEFKALVYKYMENGDLNTWLHPDQPLEPARCLNLLQRLNVAIDVASALNHLHNHSHVVVAHCDVKPSNILLDDDLTAYVGDFGLSRLLPQLQQGGSNSTIAIKGTIGYTAPEYAMGLEVSTQGDVYSYGILLLEIFTGRRPTSNAFTKGLDLHSYVKAGLFDQVWKIADPLLVSGEGQVETKLKAHECIMSALKLGIGCSQGAAKDRMDMKQVTRELHFIRDSIRLH